MNSVRRALSNAHTYQQAVREFLIGKSTAITPEERQQRVQFLGKTLRLFLPVAIVLAVTNTVVAALNADLLRGLLVNVPGLLLVLMLERLTHTRHYRMLVWLPPLLGIPLIYALALEAGEPYIFLFTLSVFPMYGALLLYMQANLLLALASIVALVVFYVAVPNEMSPRIFAQWLGMLLMIETLLIFFTAYMLHLETREQRISQNQQRLDAMRDFIRNISHDFRTPLTVIQSSAYLLLKLDDPVRRERQAHQIDRMVARMEEMLNNTVLLAKLQSTQAIAYQPVRLNELLDVVRSRYTRAAEEQAIRLEFDIPPNLPEILGDSELLLAALRHVLENALRYTSSGGEVWVSAQQTGAGAAITIADTGMGIAQDQLERIFEPMYRSDTARAMDTGGSGVGLAIAKLAVELHGGRIHVSSEEGVGSQFTINLPVHTMQTEQPGCLPLSTK